MYKELPPLPPLKPLPPLELTGNIIGGVYAELQPYVVVRWRDSRRVFGLGPTAIDAAIARGLVPKPIKFGPRACGWTGVQINEYYRSKVLAQAMVQATAIVRAGGEAA
jgi:predicted DNA-binding transcriptional regulator AlpA